MTLRLIVQWWRQDLRDWWHARRAQPQAAYPAGKEGRMVRFARAGANQGYPTYSAIARRGGFFIGRIAYRNQWGYYAFYPDGDAPLNKEIVTEIYAMLKELGS